MHIARSALTGALLLLAAASAASAEVQISLREGRVTLVATNATVRQILAEWARVGQTRIVNAERIPGGPVTIQFTDMPEQQALDFLLKSVTGYLAAPRSVPDATLSRYDRILVLPTAAVARVPVTAAPAPVFQQPVVRQPFDPGGQDGPSIPPRGPLFPTQPAMPVAVDDQFPTEPFDPNNPAAAVSGAPGTFFVPPPTGLPFALPQDGQPPAGLPFALPQDGQPFSLPLTGQPFVVPPSGPAVIGTPRPGMVVQPPPPQPGVPTIPGFVIGQPVPQPEN